MWPIWETTFSLAFDVNGQRHSVADIEPYFMTRLRPGYADRWNSGTGIFEIWATAFKGKGATGAIMGTATARFEIRD